MYYVYMLRCKDNSIYTGITVDIKRRMKEHFEQGVKSAKYTKSHQAEKIESVWETENKILASKLEYWIKSLNKQKKELIINDNKEIQRLLGEKIDIEKYRHIEEIYNIIRKR